MTIQSCNSASTSLDSKTVTLSRPWRKPDNRIQNVLGNLWSGGSALIVSSIFCCHSLGWSGDGPMSEFCRFADTFETAPLWADFWISQGNDLQVENGTLIASDGGREGSHSWALTTRSFQNCVMQWTLVRCADKGGDSKERAQVLVSVDPNGPDPVWSNALSLHPSTFQIGQLYHMRLVVANGAAAVYRRRPNVDIEELVEKGPAPRSGRIGFRFYGPFEYHIDDVFITAFSGKTAPAPNHPAAVVLGSVVRLSWQVPKELADIFRFRVERALTPDWSDVRTIAETQALSCEDPALPEGTTAQYRIAAVNLADEITCRSEPVTARTGPVGEPGVVAHQLVCPRRSGGVSIRWDAIQGQAVSEYIVLRRTPGTADAIVERRLTPGELQYLVVLPDAAKDSEYAVAADNAQGRRGPLTWMRPQEPQALDVTGTALNALLGAPDLPPWQAPPIAKVNPSENGLRPHPRLLYTQRQIDRARLRIANEPYAKSVMADLQRQANNEASTFNFTKWDCGAPWMRPCALLYALTGDESYARRVRDRLVDLADRYPTLPLKHGESKILDYQLFENDILDYQGVQPYDLIYNSSVLSDADKMHIENDLFRPMAENQMKNVRGERNSFHTASNHQCLRLAAVGMAGLCLGEQRYIDWAVRQRYGLMQQIASQINDDGLWWEKSISYHVTTAMPHLYDLAEAAYNNNIDLWNAKIPDDCLENYNDVHYALDGDNGQKSLRIACDGLLYALFPDFSGPTFGDSAADHFWGGGSYWLAWNHFRDPRYAWYNRSTANDLRRLMFDEGDAPADAKFTIGSGRFANNGVAENGSTLFPSTGLAMLRQNESDPAAPVLAFTYGPYGGGHNHGDRLAYLLYARGTHPIYHTGTYPEPEYGQYRRESVSYNTVVVDEVSHSVRDSAQMPNTGHLDFFHGDVLLQAVGATVDTCYPDVVMRRALLMGPDHLIDIFICRSPNEHQYDLSLHVDSDWDLSGFAPSAPGSRLGQGNGFQDIEVIGRKNMDGAFSTTWPFKSATGSHCINFTMLASPGTEFIACQTPGLRQHRPLRAALVARRKARSTVFISVIELGAGGPRHSQVEAIDMPASDLEGAHVGLTIRHGDLLDTIFYNEQDASTSSAAGISFTGRAAWIRSQDGKIVQASMVQGRSLTYGNRNARFDHLTSALIFDGYR